MRPVEGGVKIKVGQRVVVNGELPQWEGLAGRIVSVNDIENAPTILLELDRRFRVWAFPDQIEPESAVDRLADLTSGEPLGLAMPGLLG